MTVAVAPRIENFPGAGATGPFGFSYRILIAADGTPYISVIKTAASGTRTTLAYPGDYSFAPASLGLNGGAVTLSVALAIGETLTIAGATPLDQGTSYSNNGTFFPEAHEASYDKLTLIAQELQNNLARAASLSITSVLSAAPTLDDPVGGSLLQYSADGTRIINGPTGYNVLGDGTVGAPGLAFASEPATGLWRSGARTMALVAAGAIIATFSNPASPSDYLSFAGGATGAGVGTTTIEAKGAHSSVALYHKSKGTSTAGSQFYGSIATCGKQFFQINGANAFEITDDWWNPNVSYQGATTAWPVVSSAALAGGPDNICVIGCNSSIYPGTATGVTLMYCTRGLTGAHHFTSNGVVAHVNIGAISNPNGIDTYNTPSSALWLYGAATGSGGSAVISTQGGGSTGTTFYDSGTGGYEWKSDNTSTVLFKMVRTASGVNAWSVTAAATGNAPIFAPYGTDTDIGCVYKTKGTVNKNHAFYDGGVLQCTIGGSSTSTSNLFIAGGTAGNGPAISAQGGSNPTLTLYTTGTGQLTFATSNTAHIVFQMLDNYNIILGNSAQATTDTAGFVFFGSCAGAPTGVPSSIPSNRVAWMYDRTNNQIYIYNGAWRKTVALT